VGDEQLLEQSGEAEVADREALAAGLVAQGAGEPGLTAAGREGDILLINGLSRRRFITVITHCRESGYA
jgi:hypothetical protein